MLRSFKYATDGVFALFRYENNARFHLLAALAVIAGGIFIGLSYIDWIVIIIVIGGVWAAEAFNTAIEKLCDVVSPGIHPQIKAVKDLAAAGVLVMACAAALTGTVIFGKAILKLFSFTF
ncbi:diacylglycerol kinase family protein [Runella sp.]|uniref:diacylglycerol kinase family protein n=1 Tax=Runella sp. TaxID=1960881 RepID=UPI003D12DA64